MRYLVFFISLAILFKWLLWIAGFIFSSFWFARKQTQLKQHMAPDTTTAQDNSNARRISYKKAGRKIMPLINGINKFSNRNVSMLPLHSLRNFVYRYCLKIPAENYVVIYKGVVFRDGYKCKIGAGTIIGDDNLIDARGGIESHVLPVARSAGQALSIDRRVAAPVTEKLKQGLHIGGLCLSCIV